jgi:pimeloyl-ACP methyl ester carboxylesterase
MHQGLKDDDFKVAGNEKGPLVICVHGIMGKPDDFAPFLEAWGTDYQLRIPDLIPEDPLKTGYGNDSGDQKQILKYQLAPDMIIRYLDRKFPGRKVFLVGISFGGKICIEIAQTIPERITGLCITDVGLGPLCENSSLFNLAFNTIPTLNLKQDWPTLRAEIARLIPDRMLRILIHNHIEYPNGSQGTGQWKAGANNFYQLLRGNDLENLWPKQQQLVAPCKILKATVNSAIDDDDYQRMSAIPNIEIDVITGANHFLHVHMPDVFRDKTLEMLTKWHR